MNPVRSVIRTSAKRGRRALRRLFSEMRSPTGPAGRQLNALARSARTALASLRRQGTADDPRSLVVFYDLGHWPITYDFVWFLLAADLHRQDSGLDRMHVVFVPAEDWAAGNEEKAYYAVVDGPARLQRVFDILIPATRLLPSAAGFSFAASRREASAIADRSLGRIFPTKYFPELPYLSEHYYRRVMEAGRSGRALAVFQPPQAARDWVKRWRAGLDDERPYVTITLRYFGYNRIRNSNLEAWGAFARELEAQGFRVVIVPDTHMTLDPLPDPLHGLTIFAEAAWHLHLRAALYEAAYLNLGINTGPMSLCWFIPGCRFLVCKQVVPGGGVGDLARQLENGIDPRQPIPFFTRFQKLVVDPDELPVIRREFEKMRALIEAEAGGRASVPGSRPVPLAEGERTLAGERVRRNP